MISITGKEWKETIINKNLIEKISQDYDFSSILSKLIISRNFDYDEINSITNENNISNVFKEQKDFKNAVQLVLSTINNKENICILGDYDVDGSTATSLIVLFLKSLNTPFFFHIPDRVKDGYGASKKLFKHLIKKKPKLVIMVDCGSTSNEAIDYLNQKNIKSLIIDHHEINKPYPKSNVIINPKKDNGYIKYDYLCATTLVYFFLDLLSKKIKTEIKLSDYLIFVLLATVCDVMPIRKLNRSIALYVLKNFRITESLIFKTLYSLINKKNKLNINDIGFKIGPILNSGGRLGKSNYATELLTADSLKIINSRCSELIQLNNKRKIIEKLILDEINFYEIEKNNKDIIVYFNPNINEGLIGIICSRLKEFFNKPSIVITNSNNILKGSARSTYNYNIGKAIKNAIDNKLLITGGGHNMAGGFTLNLDKLKKFEDFLQKDFLKLRTSKKQKFNYDFEISSNAFNQDFFNDLNKIGPFGTGNPSPTFLLRDLKIIKAKILDQKHISIILKSKTGKLINSICFDSFNHKIGEYLINYKKSLNVVGQFNENFWNNKISLQLTIRDIFI